MSFDKVVSQSLRPPGSTSVAEPFKLKTSYVGMVLQTVGLLAVLCGVLMIFVSQPAVVVVSFFGGGVSCLTWGLIVQYLLDIRNLLKAQLDKSNA